MRQHGTPYKSFVLLMALMVGTTACWLQASWVNQALAITQLLAPAAINVLQLVAAFTATPANANDVARINSDTQKLIALLKGYQDASAAAQPDILAQLNAAAGETQKDFSSIFSLLHISNEKLQIKIQALTSFVLAEISSLAAIIPLAQGKVTTAKAGKPPLGAKAFKQAYNRTMAAPTGEAAADSAAQTLALK